MKKYVNLFVFVFMIGACLSQGRAQTKSAVSYKNPVVDIAMPDPTVIKAADGYFYVYATESTVKGPCGELAVATPIPHVCSPPHTDIA